MTCLPPKPPDDTSTSETVCIQQGQLSAPAGHKSVHNNPRESRLNSMLDLTWNVKSVLRLPDLNFSAKRGKKATSRVPCTTSSTNKLHTAAWQPSRDIHTLPTFQPPPHRQTCSFGNALLLAQRKMSATCPVFPLLIPSTLTLRLPSAFRA